MAKKKSNGSGEKPKPIDRTQVIVAIIGLIGTVAVALIAVMANKTTETPPTQNGNQSSTSAPATDQKTATPEPAATEPSTQNGGMCLEEYFSNVPAENRVDLYTGISSRISSNKDAVYGVRLFEGNTILGEIQFTGATNSKSFQVVSLIDANCRQIFNYGNLDRPSAKGAIGNWENLGLPFATGNYRIRMGWYSGNEIELIFAAN